MLLERVSPERTELWVAERRGAHVWLRIGAHGGAGRITSLVFQTDAEAQAGLERERDARLAEGFVVVRDVHGVDDRFASSAALARPRVVTRTVEEIARDVDRVATPCTLGAFLDAAGALLGARADERLTAVALEVGAGDDDGDGDGDDDDDGGGDDDADADDGRAAWLRATFSSGRGENPDDHAHTELVWRLTLGAPSPVADGVALDAFAEDAPAGPPLARAFVRAVGLLRDAASLRALEVVRAERA